jgi:quercetin dioxygenase-like cupin family protein
LAAAKGQEGSVTIHPDIPPGATTSGKHYHPGDEFVYVLEGNGTLEREGEPPLSLKPGVTYYVAPHQVHEVKTSGPGPLKGVGVTIAKPGEPLIVPVR